MITDARKDTARLIGRCLTDPTWRKVSASHRQGLERDATPVYLACEVHTPVSDIVQRWPHTHHWSRTNVVAMRDGERLFMAWVADPEWLNQFATVGEAMAAINTDESKTSWRYRQSGCEVT